MIKLYVKAYAKGLSRILSGGRMTKKWQQLMNQGGSAMERRNFAIAVEKFSSALPIAERSCDALERLETLTALGWAYGALTLSPKVGPLQSRISALN